MQSVVNANTETVQFIQLIERSEEKRRVIASVDCQAKVAVSDGDGHFELLIDDERKDAAAFLFTPTENESIGE